MWSEGGFKLCIIGAGSVGFSRKIVTDILLVGDLACAEIALTDIDEQRLDLVHSIVARLAQHNRLATRITKTTDRRRALEGARYVVNCVRIGGLEAFAHDIEIPLRYGVDQCVGDTLCAGGILYGQRGIAALLAFCRDIREVAERDAILFNYANPMAMLTWAAIDHGGVRSIGLCHGLQSSWHQIARVLGAMSEDVEYLAAGINHQTWFLEIRHRGKAVSGAELLGAFERDPVASAQEKVRIDVLRRFGFYSTESNGHLSEYLPWYRRCRSEVERWIDRSHWIHGETGGYLRYCREQQETFQAEYASELACAERPIAEIGRSEEHVSFILEALETGRPYRGHFNVKNDGLVTNLPADCIVEAPGYVDRFGLNMTAGLTLPDACAATCIASINVQRMAVSAAVTGDADLLKLAVLHDPLTGAVCTPDEVWRMVDEMLVAQSAWLPQYAAAIEAARSNA